jgi:alanyl-tRNA synthetase
VRQTGDIGVFVALGDSASSAGVRRIEALTGQAAFDYLSAQDHRMAELALEMNAQPGEVLERVRTLKDDRKRLENEVAQLRQQLAMSGGGSAAPEARRSTACPSSRRRFPA